MVQNNFGKQMKTKMINKRYGEEWKKKTNDFIKLKSQIHNTKNCIQKLRSFLSSLLILAAFDKSIN